MKKNDIFRNRLFVTIISIFVVFSFVLNLFISARADTGTIDVEPIEAFDITPISAMLKGQYLGTIPAKIWFYFGTSNDVIQANHKYFGYAFISEVFQDIVEGLNPGTEYHWWILAVQPNIDFDPNGDITNIGFSDLEYGGTFKTTTTYKIIDIFEEGDSCPPSENDNIPITINIDNKGLDDWFYRGFQDTYGNKVELWGVRFPSDPPHFEIRLNSDYVIGICPFEGGENSAYIYSIVDDYGNLLKFNYVNHESIDAGDVDDQGTRIWNDKDGDWYSVPGYSEKLAFDYDFETNILCVTHFNPDGSIIKSKCATPEIGSFIWDDVVIKDPVIPFGAPMTGDTKVTLDMHPKCLNKKSRGRWVTCYLELPEEYDLEEIDIMKVLLNDMISPKDHPVNIGDHDSDEIPDIMLKFDRRELIKLLDKGKKVEIKITGELFDGTQFEGFDYIKVK